MVAQCIAISSGKQEDIGSGRQTDLRLSTGISKTIQNQDCKMNEQTVPVPLKK